MTHRLLEYMKLVDKTHKGLGRLYSFTLMMNKARKVTIIIAIAGSGKTTALTAASDVNPKGVISLDSVTRSGMKALESKMNGFEGTVIINDLGNIDTGYSTKESVKVAVALTYEHHLSKLNAMTNINIENFNGSFVTSAQPSIMQSIVNVSDWEAVIRDKTARYYHLYRPINPNESPLNIKASWGKNFEAVKYKEIKCPELTELNKVGLSQWGLARTHIHIKDILRACAALDNRLFTNKSDILTALELTRPMRMENFIIDKQGFESKKEFLGDHLCMLTEFASYPKVTKTIISSDFFVGLRTVDRLLSQVRELYMPDPLDKENLLMTDISKRVLKECGYL